MNIFLLIILIIITLIVIFIIISLIKSKKIKSNLFDKSFWIAKNYSEERHASLFVKDELSKKKLKEDFDKIKDIQNRFSLGKKRKIFLDKNQKKEEPKPTEGEKEPKVKTEEKKVENKGNGKKVIERKKIKGEKEQAKEDKKEKKQEKILPVKRVIIRFKSMESVLEIIKNPGAADIIKYLKSKNYNFLDKVLLEKDFNSIEEFLQFFKQELVIFLKNEYEEIKRKISEFRKKGKDANDISFRAMSIPLKIKIFNASFSLKDFSIVFGMIENISNELKKFE